ncbi:YceD family protein [Usitatibacter palustris]|uniref:Large ribosomal RNA subunit accumulation protein YceD n=1 Tax=Usitatibacter palustris TaxID=2732487 RepID=A0A6M4H907_9PROT|nr:YceD family protein [Usitatibacter palustris]QJR15213.1 hypothetical protein DSM104440_02030 [Usitatibacter palustris]
MADDWIIDPTMLSTKPKVLSGRLTPADLDGVLDLVAGPEGEFDYTVSAYLDKQQRKVVSCIIKGFAPLTCQSTLEVFRFDVAIEDRLVLVDDESSLPPIEMESEDEDFVVVDGPIDVRDLVEDAVILALPMVPRKPGLEDVPAKAEDVPKKESPFAVLRAVKKPDQR